MPVQPVPSKTRFHKRKCVASTVYGIVLDNDITAFCSSVKYMKGLLLFVLFFFSKNLEFTDFV